MSDSTDNAADDVQLPPDAPDDSGVPSHSGVRCGGASPHDAEKFDGMETDAEKFDGMETDGMETDVECMDGTQLAPPPNPTCENSQNRRVGTDPHILQCEFCNREYKTERGLTKHISTKHSEDACNSTDEPKISADDAEREASEYIEELKISSHDAECMDESSQNRRVGTDPHSGSPLSQMCYVILVGSASLIEQTYTQLKGFAKRISEAQEQYTKEIDGVLQEYELGIPGEDLSPTNQLLLHLGIDAVAAGISGTDPHSAEDS